MIDEKKLIKFINSEEFQMRFIRSPKSVQEILLEFIEEQPRISGWIPCSERLPTMEECLKNNCCFILDDGNCRYHGLFDYIGKRFIYSTDEGQKNRQLRHCMASISRSIC